MKFAVGPMQKSFFERHGYIGFEEMLQPSKLDELIKETQKVLLMRSAARSLEDLSSLAPERLFAYGRDLWRDSSMIKQRLGAKSQAAFAAELFSTKSLRLGFDQLFIAPARPSQEEPKKGSWQAFMNEPRSLSEWCSFTAPAGAVIFCLGKIDGSESAPLPEPWPQAKGDALFISKSLYLDLPALMQPGRFDYLMLCYTQPICLYTPNSFDPNDSLMKKMGYSSGDKLNSLYHPFLL